MPVLLLIATLIIVIINWNNKDGLPLSERWRQDTMIDC